MENNWFSERVRGRARIGRVNLCQCSSILSWSHRPAEIWETHVVTGSGKFRERVTEQCQNPRTRTGLQMCVRMVWRSVNSSTRDLIQGISSPLSPIYTSPYNQNLTSYLDAWPLSLMLQSVWTELTFTVHLLPLSKCWRLSKGLPLVHALWSTSAGERNPATNGNKSGQSPSFDTLYVRLCVKTVYSLIIVNHCAAVCVFFGTFNAFTAKLCDIPASNETIRDHHMSNRVIDQIWKLWKP